MKQHMAHRSLQEIAPLRQASPFFSAVPRLRKYGLGHAPSPSLLTRQVQQTEREAPSSASPLTPPTPRHTHLPNGSSDSSSSSSSTNNSLRSDPQPSPHHAADTSNQSEGATTTTQPSSEAPGAAPQSPPQTPNQQPPLSDPPSSSGRRQRRRTFGGRPGTSTILATYGAYIGAIGTLAVGTAWATDINLAAMFQWSPQAVEQALLTLIPLTAFNTLIMLPDYSTWKLPKLDEGASDVLARIAPMPDSPASTAATTTTEPSIASTSPAAAAAAAAAVPLAGDAVPPSSTGDKVKKTPASVWGKKKHSNFRVFKDAMHLAQGHYTANNPTVSISPAMELLTAGAQSLAGELLYRGVAMTLLSTWLLDRFYEAGVDDVLTLPFTSQPVEISDAASWAAALLLVAVSAGLALRKVLLAPRPRIISVVDLSKGRARGEAQSKGQSVPGSSSGQRAAAQGQAQEQGQLPRSFQQVTTLAAAVQGARNVLQTLVLNVVFVMSGSNLTASVSASLANQLLFSLLQRNSMERMHRRSAELSKELEVFNSRLREIQRKNAAQRSASAAAAGSAEVAAAVGEAATQADSAVTPSALSHAAAGAASGLGDEDGTQGLGGAHLHQHAQLHGSMGSALGAQGASEGEVLLHAAAVATAVESAVDAAADAAAAQPAVAAAAAGQHSTGASPDQLTRALLALERLLPADPAAATSTTSTTPKQK